ncbi:MAG: hypothetical protein ACXVUL_04035 [Solirubrobacteraceae bacterium]
MNSESPITLSIEPDGRGAWELSEGLDHVSCATLEDAKRTAYRRAAHRRACELIVRDAYHRVIDWELIDPDPRRRGLSGAGG